MLVSLPEPYDFALSTRRLHASGPDLVHGFHAGSRSRFIAGREVRFTPAPGGVEVTPFDAARRPGAEKLLGAEVDLTPFGAWTASDPVLAALLLRLEGLRPPLLADAFERLVTSITAQQVSPRSARATRTRLFERHGRRGQRAVAFPSRAVLGDGRPEELVALGFSRREAEYVLELAAAPSELDALGSASDDELRAALRSLRALGPWTAESFLARHVGRPRAWPAGDLMLRKTARLFYRMEVRQLGQRLAPFQNLSAHFLLAAFGVS